MELRTSNPLLQDLITTLDRQGSKNKAALWKDLATKLNRPRSKREYVNLWEISRNAKEGETIIVPGKVLGYGDVGARITIAAFKFSEMARRKILEGKGKALSIQELMKENPKGVGVRIMA